MSAKGLSLVCYMRNHWLSAALLIGVLAFLAGCGDSPVIGDLAKNSFGKIYFDISHKSAYDVSIRKDVPQEEHLRAAHLRCLQIPKNEGRKSIMDALGNEQIYFSRSKCIFNLARYARDSLVCDEVIEAKAFFHNGTRFTPENCKAEVLSLIKSDQFYEKYKISPESYRPHQPLEVRIEPEGGKYKIIVVSEGALKGRYQTQIFVLPPENWTREEMIQLEPLEVEVNSGRDQSIFYFSGRGLNFPAYLKRFRVSATLIGPIEIEGVKTYDIFAQRKPVALISPEYRR